MRISRQRRVQQIPAELPDTSKVPQQIVPVRLRYRRDVRPDIRGVQVTRGDGSDERSYTRA
tara:strand:+ start:1383 stop:1565 length:183 start_codon:yes stop_codon:yes gene_type:complete